MQRMRNIVFCLWLLTCPWILSLQPAHAQDSGGSGHNEIGIFSGRILPNVSGASEIFSLTGVRYSRSFTDNGLGFWEVGGLTGNGSGVEWKGAFASLRMNIPVETIIAFTYLGLDFTRYKGENTETVNRGGYHVGGGMMSLIGGGTWFRFDMKLNSQPGTSLYFALGLVFDF
jgi:hypothetical protein